MSSKQVLVRASVMVAGSLLQGAALSADFTDHKGKAHKIEVKGTQAILIGMNQPAPDGVYRGKDGKSITVKNGNVVQGAVAPAAAHKSIKDGVVQKGATTAMKSEQKVVK
jgi:hypothetical protein